MKNLILFVMLSAASFLYGQQTEGLKTQKTTGISIMERKLPEKSNDSIAKSNLNAILKQKDNSQIVIHSIE